MTKQILYIGDRNRALFEMSLALIGGDICSLSDSGSADLAILDRVPDNAADLLSEIGTRTARLLCVPPLCGARGDGGTFLRMAKRSGVTMAPMTTPRFHPGLATVLEVAGSGVLGTDLQAVIRRRGNWPFFPLTRDGEARSEWWDRLWLHQGGLLENGRVEMTEGEIFEIELTLIGSTGRVDHRQWLREDGLCEWTVDSDMGANGGRKRMGRFPVELPLAIELSRILTSPANPLTNRDMNIWTDRERKLV